MNNKPKTSRKTRVVPVKIQSKKPIRKKTALKAGKTAVVLKKRRRSPVVRAGNESHAVVDVAVDKVQSSRIGDTAQSRLARVLEKMPASPLLPAGIGTDIEEELVKRWQKDLVWKQPKAKGSSGVSGKVRRRSLKDLLPFVNRDFTYLAYSGSYPFYANHDKIKPTASAPTAIVAARPRAVRLFAGALILLLAALFAVSALPADMVSALTGSVDKLVLWPVYLIDRDTANMAATGVQERPAGNILPPAWPFGKDLPDKEALSGYIRRLQHDLPDGAGGQTADILVDKEDLDGQVAGASAGSGE